MFGANLTWGLMAPIVKLVLASGVIAPLLLVDFRMAGAACLFWLTSLFLPREHVPWRDVLRLFGAGMLGVCFNQGCFIVGVSLTSPGEASLVTTTMPMWVMFLAWVILGEPISLKKAGGIALGAFRCLKPRFGRRDSAVCSAELRSLSYPLPQFHKEIFSRHHNEMDVSCGHDCIHTGQFSGYHIY